MTKAKAKWRDVLPVHPCAAIFPRLPDDQLKELADDIKKNGLKESIVVWSEHGLGPEHGLKDSEPDPEFLLDGVNRLDALEKAGYTLVTDGRIDSLLGGAGGFGSNDAKVQHRHGKTFDTVSKTWQDDVDPPTFVTSINIRRRHLTKSERARFALKAFLAMDEWKNQLGPNGEIPKAPGTTYTFVDDPGPRSKKRVVAKPGLVGKIVNATGVPKNIVSTQLAAMRDPEINGKLESGELTPGQAANAAVAKKNRSSADKTAHRKVATLPTSNVHAKTALQELTAIDPKSLSKQGWTVLGQVQKKLSAIYDTNEVKTK